MQLHVKGKNLEVSDSMRAYVERRLQKLDRRVHELTEVEIEPRSSGTRRSPTRRWPRPPST